MFKNIFSLMASGLIFGSAIMVMAQPPETKKDPAPAKKAAPKNDAMTPITDTPGLPRVLLIGDSISIGYTLPVRELLRGKANVHRVLTNCGPTKNVKVLDSWLDDKRTGGAKWDVIHFNFGLHDVKYADEKGTLIQVTDTGKPQVSPEDYEKNLREIVGKLKATGARLIWCSTTPVPEGAKGRVPGDEVKYNAIALKIMKEHNIAVDDLYTFALPKLDMIQKKADVHFSDAGSKELASQVVSTIEAALKK
jgi:acyl-CoA thioesterase-1